MDITLNLNLKDRVIILNGVLPKYDTRCGIDLKISIGAKLMLSTREESEIVYNDIGSGQFTVSFKTIEAITNTNVYTLTPEELEYLVQRVEQIDRSGMFSIETMDTYNKILDSATPEELPTVEQSE